MFGKNFKTIRFRFKGLEKPDRDEMDIRILNLKHGLRTINEYREEDGFEPVAWGNKPLLLQKKGSPGSGGEEGLESEQEPDRGRDVDEE